MLARIHELATQRENFAFETTLASRTFYPWIMSLKKQGYQFHLSFLWLSDEELAVSRVRGRVKMGGHDIPEGTIRRRYHAGLKNFFRLYKNIADSWRLYDNSDSQKLDIIASKKDGLLNVSRKDIWQNFLEIYDET
jgi:predicted ABC-type ATPase